MEKKHKNYYLGLDIGTNSIGWAVADEDYKLIRKHGKSLWGVRLFTEAATAKDRRLARLARRRIQKRKERLQLLQAIFAPVVNAIDPSFFSRLEESNLYESDKLSKTRFSLFADKDFNDTDFHRQYRTIYHLRLAMMQQQDPDPRLVYLALHHMIKYRGHFLIEGDIVDAVNSIEEPIEVINDWLRENELPQLFVKDMSEIITALQLPKLSLRKSELVRLFNVRDKKVKALVELIAGSTVSADKIFDSVSGDEKVKLDFGMDWSDLEPVVQESIGEDSFVVEKARNLYDFGRLKQLLGDHKYLSEGMVAKYEKHRADLAALKKVLKEYFPKEVYAEMFGAAKKQCNYTEYSGKYDFGKRDAAPFEKSDVARTQEDFYKYVRSVLSASDRAQEDPQVKQMLLDMENGAFMPKQVSKANAVLPYQCNWIELVAILNNAEKYEAFSFLKDADEDGVTAREKIESLLKFRMPYYVGPVNNHSGKYWIVRREDGKIYPWNVEKKIDLQKTEDAFILRMTNYCQYVPGEKVLPKSSLLYEEVALLNLLNKIRIGDSLLPVDLKNRLSLYFAIPQNGQVIGKMSRKALLKWFKKEGAVSMDASEQDIGGIDEEIPIGRRTYASLCKILGSADAVEKNRDRLEQLILWATIAGPEKSNLRRRIFDYNQTTENWLTDSQIKRFVGLSINGWGAFSKQLVCGRYGTNMETGELQCVSIMDMLRNTNCNLSELLNNPIYGFKDSLEDLRELDGDVTYKTINELYCSPAIKKQIWQSLKVVREIRKVMGCDPKKIFVEMARGSDKDLKGKRSIFRKKALESALAKLEEQRLDLTDRDVLTRLTETDNKDLQRKKLFLYFMQNGIDAYTGEPIDYNHLSAYDLDHIYPRSKIKDDSLHENMVLTAHIQNLRKKDIYPLSRETQDKMRGYWLAWMNAGLITKEKYARLTRTTPLTEEECADFINRQLIETQQSTKLVCSLLKQQFSESEIVYSKAKLVSEFRQGVVYGRDDQGNDLAERFLKVREINDLHHAKDAYLNIVVGNVYNTKFGHNARVYFSNNGIDHIALDKLFRYRTEGAWIPGEEGSIAQVRKVMANNAVLFTRKSYETGGIFNKVGMLPKGKGSAPLKNGQSGKRAAMSDIEKYGGYTSEARRYYMLVQHERKGETLYTLLGVLGRFAPLPADPAAKRAYCEAQGLISPVVLIDRIGIDTMFDINGAELCLSGTTGNSIIWKLSSQCGYSREEEAYCKKLFNVVEKYRQSKKTYYLTAEDGIVPEKNDSLYDRLMEKLSESKYEAIAPLKTFTRKLQEKKETFTELDAMNQCIVLTEIIKKLAGVQESDLSLLGESSRSGSVVLSATRKDLSGLQIVHRSVTGIFEKRIPLDTLISPKA